MAIQEKSAARYYAVCSCNQPFGGVKPPCPIHDAPQKTTTTFAATIRRQNPQEQLDLFQALELVEQAADKRWLEEATKRVKYLCQTRYEFTTDAMWSHLDTLDVSTPEGRAMGSVMTNAAKAGWCEATDRSKPSSRPVCHKRKLQVWRSLLLPA